MEKKGNIININDREYVLRKKQRNILYACIAGIIVTSFVLGFLVCTEIYFEFPLTATVCYEGYYNKPLCGHYGAFMESFTLQETNNVN